jgi:hypothetical protein
VKILNKISQFIIPRYLILLAVLCLLPVLIYYFFSSTIDNESSIQKDDLIDSLPELMRLVSDRWSLGDIEGLYGTDKFQCEHIPNDDELYNSQFLKCNPEYLKCIFNGNVEGVDSSFKLGRIELVPILNNNKSIEFQKYGKIKINFIEKTLRKKVSVQLDNFCHSVYLPKNIYSAGPQTEQAYVWDNLNYDVFVDKFYVTNYDVARWLNKLSVNKHNLYKPSTALNYEDREQYCLDQGKTILSSRVFDASAFYPNKRVDNFSFKYPYPWTKKRTTFLSTEEKISKFDCKKTYTKECYEISKKKYFSSNSISWIGMTSVLGEEMESFSNIYNNQANLKVSSSSLSRNSKWHKSGLRGHWNGNDFEKRDFSFVEQYSNNRFFDNIQELGVAFRCMTIR